MIKRILKKNSHNLVFKALAGFGRSLNRFYENRNHDLQSNGELTLLKKLVKFKPVVIVDGGANIGDYALYASRICPNANIYAFEPVKETFAQLETNTENHPKVIPIQKGLYKDNCSKRINLFSSSEHSTIYNLQGLSYDSVKTANIELIKGDDFLKENKIDTVDLLKLDLEGAEYDAILGFEETIKDGKVKIIQFEYGYINISTKKLLIDFYKFFESHGYIVGKIFPKNIEFRKYEFKYEDFLGPNHIAIKRSETELIKILQQK